MTAAINPKLALGALAALAAVGIIVYAKGKLPAVGAAVGDTLHAVNPFNQENVFYTGVNSLGARASGDQNWNLGARLWEVMNPRAMAAERAVLGDAPFIDGDAPGLWRTEWVY